MGRRADPPGLQAAKGHPGKRKAGVKARMNEAQRVAKLLADAPGASGLEPPLFLDDRYPAAVAVWKLLAPRLRETHRLSSIHRLVFAQLCVYYAEWVEAIEDIRLHGYSQVVPMTGGFGTMERMRPSVRIRDIAYSAVIDLSKHFGLTPSDEYALFAHQRVAAGANPGLFDQVDGDAPAAPPPESDTAQQPPQPAAPQSLLGNVASLDSPPPIQRLN